MSWLSDLFGGGKKQEAVQTYFPSQDPRYKLAQKNLEDIIAKRGYYGESEMGYTPSTINSLTAPYASARRENLKNYDIPLISSQASARGLGRSTIPVNTIARTAGEAERDIAEQIAQRVSESEQLKANQKSQNLQAYLNAISGEAGLADKEIAAQQDAMGRAAEVQRTNQANAITGTQNATIFGTQAAGPLLSGVAPFLSAIPVVGPALSAGASILGGGASALGGALSADKSAMVSKSGDNELKTWLESLFTKKSSRTTIGVEELMKGGNFSLA